MYHRHGHMGIPWTVANGCGRLRTVANVNATSSEHILNRQTPRVKREPLLRIRKNICQIRDTNVGGNYSVSGCKRNHAWFVITSSLLAFLGRHAAGTSKQFLDRKPQRTNTWVSGTPMRCFFFSFAERQKFLLEILSIALCLQNCLLGNPETKAALTNIPLYKYPDLPKIISIYFHRFLGVPKLSHYISWFNQTIPRSFSFAQTIPMHYLLALPKLSRMIPVEFFFAPTISCSYILSCHTPVCCNCKNLLKCLNLALDGFQRFQLNMLLASGKSCIKKKFGFGRVKSPVR